MLSDLQLVYMVHRNSTQLLSINTTKFQVEREPVYKMLIVLAPIVFTKHHTGDNFLRYNITPFFYFPVKAVTDNDLKKYAKGGIYLNLLLFFKINDLLNNCL